jgi:alkanesulfonate monooxygenase SsuD/methylene tetrahydromethanopterin reductase-like flavin-dependent oxidoreductase (luciferase family)
VQAWTGGEFEWKSKHYQFPKLNVFPKPLQKPHPPIYVTANRDPESFAMIAARGHHLMTLPWIATNEIQGPRVRQYQDALSAAGHAANKRDIFVMYPIYVGDDDAQARTEVIEHWHRWRTFALEAMGLLATKDEAHQRVFNHLTYDLMVRDSRGIFGGPESCARILRKIIEVVGVTHIGLTFHFGGLSQDRVLKSMERFARQVRPAL